MRRKNTDRHRPAWVMAGILLRGGGLVFLLAALLFNTYLLSAIDPTPPLGEVTERGIRTAQIVYFVSGLLLLLLADVIHPSFMHRRLQNAFSRPRTLHLLLLLLSLAVPIVLLELALRPFTIDHLSRASTTMFLQDPDLGWRLRPDHRGPWGGVEVRINRRGLRGPIVPYERTPQAFRILYLGDSVTFGYGLARHDMAFPYVVEALLEQRKRVEVETINAGVGGYSPWQHDVYLRTEGVKYRPDVVVVGFVLNDVTEKFDLVRFGGTGLGHQLSMSSVTLEDWLARNTGIYAAVRRVKTRLAFGKNRRQGAIARERVSVEALAREPDAQRVRDAWDLTLENVERIVMFCRENDLRLVMVVFPFTFQFEDPASLDAPQRALASFCGEHDIPLLDVLPLLSRHMRDHDLSPQDLFLDADHFSAEGNAVVAPFIADFVEREVPTDTWSGADGERSGTIEP